MTNLTTGLSQTVFCSVVIAGLSMAACSQAQVDVASVTAATDLVVQGAGEQGGPVAPAEPKFLMTSFRGTGDGLHLARSYDGYVWTDLSKVLLKPEIGGQLMRDPHILQGPDGTYHMVWTTGWHDSGIGYASSKDLIHWSEQKNIPVMAKTPGVRNCWAPETVYDEANDQFIIMWSSDLRGRFEDTRDPGQMNNRAYYVTTKDFESFSQPKVLFDPGFDNIDSTLLKLDDGYLLVFKQGDRQQQSIWGPIWAAIGPTPLGPFEVMPKPIITERAEGPALVKLGDEIVLYADFYANGRYGAYATKDLQTWRDISDSTQVVDGQRHGSILSASRQTMDGLLEDERQALAAVPTPILDGYTADPSIRVFGDTYYVYPTSDKPNWNTTDFSVWSSKNLVDWQNEGMILDVANDLSWGKIKAWAPDCIEKEGKYYFYFCAEGVIGVATSDSPTGPFVDALGKPLAARDMMVGNTKLRTYAIDPWAFIDDDGQAYLYFGNGTPTVCKLSDDMLSFVGDAVEFPLKQFREGIVTFKRNGKYYFMWSIDDARSPDYRVGWGVSDSPYGPVESPEDGFIVLRQNGLAIGTAHHSVVNVPGTDRWYAAYHRHAIPGGGGYKRQTCLVEMKFDEQGNILPMDPMTQPFEPGDIGEPIVDGKGLPEKP